MGLDEVPNNGPEAYSRPPGPGLVANLSPDPGTQPAHSYSCTSDPTFCALGGRRGPERPKKDLLGGGMDEVSDSGPEADPRPPGPGLVANHSPDPGTQPANSYLGTSDTIFCALGRRRGPERPKKDARGSG